MKAFAEWLQSEMDRRGISKAELARLGDIDSGSVSNVLNGPRGPGPEFCRGVARAFRMPQNLVFIRAGLMDDQLVGEVSELRARINYLLDMLDERWLQMLLRQIEQVILPMQQGDGDAAKGSFRVHQGSDKENQ